MKKQIIYFTAVLSLIFITSVNAEIVFQDTFDNVPGSGDINMSNTVAGRQFGTLAPLSYSEIGSPGSLVGDSAPFPGKLNWGPNMISPNHNFTELTGGFTVEFDVLTTGVVSWTGISIGAESQDERLNTTKGIGFLFHREGYFQMSDDSAIVAAFGPETIPSGQFFHVLISVSTKSFDGDNDVKVALFIDGKPININNLGGQNNLIYTRKKSFKSNYIILDSWAEPTSRTTIDNFTIRSTVSKFYEYNWTNDASSQIDSSKTYSHKINLGDDDDITINSELFTGSSSNISGAGWSLINGYGDNNFARGTVANPAITGVGTNLVYEFFLEGYNQSSAIILSNLTPGAMYTFTLYNRGYAGNRKAIFAAGDSESAIVELDPNLNGNGGTLFKYIYEAPSNGVFSMAVTPPETNSNQYLFYAFSNELSPPAPAGNISASQGEFSDKVVVSWSAVSGTEKYQMWRNTTDDSSGATAISAELSETIFTDTTATVNLDYYYWVKSGNTNGWSDFSESALGFSTDSTGPDKPVNVSPTDGKNISDFPVTLTGSTYSDTTWAMQSAEWQISDNTNYSSTIWDSGEILTNATNIIAPSGPLVPTNYWRVRYKNNRNKWSEWSDYTSFIAERDFASPLYFYETFNNVSGSGDVNKDYYVTGRQIGSATPVDYVLQGTTIVGDTAANPNKLTLSGEDSSCSPNQSFDKFGNFKIDVDIEPSAQGAAICFGKATKNAKPKSSGGIALVFYGDGSGRYDLYDSETLVGTFNNDVVKSSSFHLMISVGGEFENSAMISTFADGTPLAVFPVFFPQAFHSNHFNYVYEKNSGFSKNFITLYNLNGSSKFDNLQIQKTSTNLNIFAWTDDDDSRIDSANNYTHAVNLNTTGNIDINGVTFIGSGTSVVYGLNPVGAVHQRFVENGTAGLTGSNWVISAADDLFETDSDWTAPANNLPAEGNNLLDHFLFSSWDGVQIKLSNLSPNSSNVFAMHFFEWSAGFEMPIVASDGGAPQNTSMDIGAPGDGLIFEYKYKADDNGEFIFTISKVQHPLFSFCNYETTTPEPNLFTIDSLDFGEVVQGESKTFQLPAFNFGAGIVSGVIDGITSPFGFLGVSNYFAQPESPDFVSITFSPLAEGEYSNTVSLIGSGGNVEIELKGIGVPECGLIFSILFSVFCIWRKLIPTENISG